MRILSCILLLALLPSPALASLDPAPQPGSERATADTRANADISERSSRGGGKGSGGEGGG